jgi:drug/metabolite transporter (DMT)-like permease
MARRPGLACELGQRHRVTVTLRRRMVCREHEVHGVAPQVLAVDARGPRERLVLPLVGQDEIDVPESEHGQRLLGLRLDVRALARRDVVFAVALGAVGYSAQAGCAFAALDRLDASLFSLLLYTFPVFVTVSAIALGREPASRRTAAALVLASTGLVLVLAGAAAGAPDPLGTTLALAAAVVYSAYILSSEGVSARVGPIVLSTLLCTGAATTLTLRGFASGDLDPGSVSLAGFAWLSGLAVVSTVRAIALFFAGLRRVGPTGASILSTLEPVVTVALAFVVFGESLGPAQLAGGALVLSAVLAVRAPVRTPKLQKEA